MAKMYAVALDQPAPTVEKRLKEHYASVFKHTNSFYLVVGGVNDVAEDVAMAAGIKGEQRHFSGVVFRLDGSYSGYTRGALWEWLKDVSASAPSAHTVAAAPHEQVGV